MSHEEFKKEAQKMFNGQFPNEIMMRKPDSSLLFSKDTEISEEIKEFINVTIDKYRELVIL
jgi:hypothetical protein